MKNYRNAFFIILAMALMLAGALGYVGWRYVLHAPAPASMGAQAASPATIGVTGAAAELSAGQTGPTAGPPQTKLTAIQLSPERLQSIGVAIGTVKRQVVHDDIRVVGDVTVDEQKQAYVQTRFSGWIQRVLANASYQYVKKGQPLFTIYSPDLVTTEQEYLIAKRSQGLLTTSTVPGVSAGAASLLGAAEERLRQWDIPEREIARLDRSGQVEQNLTIDSPVSGFITERNALPNMYVQPATRLYSVADFSTIWVNAEVFQNDLARMRIGEPATLSVDSYPGRVVNGRVDFIYPTVDMTTRTAQVRLVFSNSGLLLRPGMFVNVDLKVPLGEQLTIPASGVLQTGTREVVFVDRGDGYLQPQDVELGEQVGDEYVVRKGLKAGERIVTSANFLIDSESQLEAALGSFAPPPPGAGAAAAMNARQGNAELSSDPNPPRKGSNVFRVKLTDGKGVAISGAQVTITFFMPAMPAMGMAAMRTVVTMSDKSDGTYEGWGQLGSGGTWEVTITARQNGQTIVNKRMNVNATGGM
jgi:Cu(I)/Ag(I) efflux system membrane fusion protein